MLKSRIALSCGLATALCLSGASPANAQSRTGDDRQGQKQWDQDRYPDDGTRDRDHDTRYGDDRNDHSDSGSQWSDRNTSSQDQDRKARQVIADFDDNEDGSLQRDEAPRRLQDKFESLDKNGDNRLSVQELRQSSQQQMSHRKIAMPVEVVYIWVTDTHHGNLSLDELQRAYDTMQKIDEDGNGTLSRQELQAEQRQVATRWAKSIAKRLDENDDSRISRDEASNTFLARSFDKVDEDGNDRLSVQELRTCILDGHTERKDSKQGSSTQQTSTNDRSGSERYQSTSQSSSQ